MLEILKGDNKTIRKHAVELAKIYKEKTGRVVCLSCAGDISYMISSLKLIYKMKNFEFRKENAHYKNKKGDRVTISNSNMTDEKAIEFLKINPERISLFSKYPDNWKELIGIKKKKKSRQIFDIEVIDAIHENDCCEEEHDEPCEECKEKKKAELNEMSLKELREAYPEIKSNSKEKFIDKILG